ncbi:MAG: spermidine/putrescine ABC transporter permease [Legionellaceae bacterium]|nr:spermidine/putrescine ABC transporter permease [Legionellaceae bacterium]|tara:strand:+ start:265 stop:1119 length:855 start_codon:yes stop_codon:yes gene_type:complete
MFTDKQFKTFSIALIFGWLGIFALLPCVMMFVASFLQHRGDQFFTLHFTLGNYRTVFSPLYFHVFFRSLVFSFVVTLCCLLIAYPFALIVSRLPKTWRFFFLLLIIIPFWTSSLIRSYAIVAIIQADGLISHVLLFLHIIHRPLQILYTPIAVIIGLVYSLLPFMILPLYANLEKFDWQLIDAAYDLGASKWWAYYRILLPLSVPGILSGVLMVSLPAMTMFFIPDILGGAHSLLLGNLIKNEFLDLQNWPLGSSMSIVLTLVMAVLLLVYWRFSNSKQRGGFL